MGKWNYASFFLLLLSLFIVPMILMFQIRKFQFSFFDCPGIDLQDDEIDSPEYIGMIHEVKNCQSFIFIIDASRDSGVKKRGVI